MTDSPTPRQPREPRQPLRAERTPSDWSARPIPQPAPERRTADPDTPTLRELAARERQRASLAAGPGATERTHGPNAGEAVAPAPAALAGAAPLDCRAAWGRYDGEADAVLARGHGDPFERNRAISARYAEVFLSDPQRRFRWLGAGAFASKQVGCGIFDAQEMARTTSAWDLRHRMAQTAERKLGEGNAAVFRDIVPPHRMYQDHGIDGIRRCGAARPGGAMDPQMTQAFEDMARGDDESLRASAARMVRYEQNDVLQPLVFDDPDTATMLRRNQAAQNVANALPGSLGSIAQGTASSFGSRPMKVAFAADCSGPYELEFTGDDPASPRQRVPYAQAVVRSFSDQISAGGGPRATTEEALSQLAAFHPYRGAPVSRGSRPRPWPRAAAFLAVGGAAFAVGGGAVAARARTTPRHAMSTPSTLDTAAPVLRLTLGDSVAEVTRHSDVPLPDYRDPERDPPFIVGKPLTVEYTRPGTAVRFPTGRFTSVTVEYGHAVQLRISPHLRALTLEEALGLARELGALVERAGWRRASTDLPLDAVPAAITAYRHTVAGQAVGYRAQLARWGGRAGDTLLLSLRRQASAEDVRDENAILGKSRPEVDHYLLSVDLQNIGVSDHYYRLTVATRQQGARAPH